MVKRYFWMDRIRSAWTERPIVWLTGVRRSGKTVLSQSIPDALYLDCELPRNRRLLEDPESFWESVNQKHVILDEIHRLPNPSELLKIAADHHKHLRILATGSSTLSAGARFRDTLTGRKRTVFLTPMCVEDMNSFGQHDWNHRFIRGGLPEFFCSQHFPEKDFQEWMDSYWARDIQEMFRLERRHAFQTFFELLLAQSGGIFEASRFASSCGVSHPTIMNYLKAMEATWVAHVIRPFSSRRSTEIVTAPKVYGFDTGFVCYYRGWSHLRKEDMGILWEHIVLNELLAHGYGEHLRYWRNKQQCEIDFLLVRPGQQPIVIECKWSDHDVPLQNIATFRKNYPQGENFVVSHNIKQSRTQTVNGLRIQYTSVQGLLNKL